MKKLFTSAIAALCLVCAGNAIAAEKASARYDVVPLPASIALKDQPGFTLTKSTVISYPKGDKQLKRNAELLADYLFQTTGLKLQLTTKQPKKNAIILTANLKSDNSEAYRLTVNDNAISIDGATAAGNFYGIQTLRKSSASFIDNAGEKAFTFPSVEISDQPRFSYRGTHFDTSRHFFPVDSIKTFIDMLALHNINRFHWHITDDQGWRLEIKKYPLLTEIGSRRDGTCVGKDFESSDSIPYGGFYTQDEARDIVRYAADRHITVIPEIDMPGHMLAALTAYPQLGCTGGPYAVWQRWGVSDDVLCAGNDETLAFIDDVLAEVADIFPSEYIHIGGDECPKDRWAECPKCQQRIKDLGLKTDSHSTAEQKLQNFVMEHAATTLAGLGRKMIGWDEIVEGGLFPGATVMSWRGVEGAREAAKQGHDAIMTPTNYCYFDYLQSQDPSTEPFGIGGFVPVSKVYSLEPTETLTPEQAKHILGAQANIWTEYMPNLWHVEYMTIPRLAAMSEVQWLQPEKKNYTEFTHRLLPLIELYKRLGYNYAKHVFDIQGGLECDYDNHSIVANLRTVDGAPIHYTTDGSTPTEQSPLYTGPVVLTKSGPFKAAAFRNHQPSRVFSDSVSFNKATSSKVTLLSEPHSRYNGPAVILTDGRFGPMSFNTGEWMGFNGNPLIAVVDMGAEKEFSKVSLRTLIDGLNWIVDTRGITVEVSDNGQDFTTVASKEVAPMDAYVTDIYTHTLTFDPVKARYVKVTALCETELPKFQDAGAGKPGFLFVDEIVVE